MGELTIKTNKHWRNLLYGYEITPKEREDFDYIYPEEFDSHAFFRYRGVVYDPSEFERVSSTMLLRWSSMSTWQGYQSDSFFSGILIRYSRDCERVQVGTYFS